MGTTNRYIHRILKDIFQRAVDWRIIKINPVSSVKRPKVKERESNVYGEDEVRELAAKWQGGDKFYVFSSEFGKPFYHTAPGKCFLVF